MESESLARDPLNANFRSFAREPTIQSCQQTLTWSWKNSFRPFIKQDKANPEFWYVNSRDGIPIESTLNIFYIFFLNNYQIQN